MTATMAVRDRHHSPATSQTSAPIEASAAHRTRSTAPATRTPNAPTVGSLDGATEIDEGSVRIRGWALDYATEDPATIHVYVDGVFVTAAVADGTRSDVAAAFGNGGFHGNEGSRRNNNNSG